MDLSWAYDHWVSCWLGQVSSRSRAEFTGNSLWYLLQCPDWLTGSGPDSYRQSDRAHSSRKGSRRPVPASESSASARSRLESEGWVTCAREEHPSPWWRQRGLNDPALAQTPVFCLSLCNIHLYINISRGIYSILPYGQQLLFLPGCHLFSCYFFDFIFKQYNMEYSNIEHGTDGEQIQITDFQCHPNISDWAGVGDKTRLSDCSKQTNMNKSPSKWGKWEPRRKWNT